MVGRITKATQTLVSNMLPIEWFIIEYQPDTSYIKDKIVKKNSMMTRIRQGTYHISIIDQVIQFYKDQKLRHVKAIPLKMDLPLYCPSCERIGSPEITEDKRFEIKNKKYNLIFNHSSGTKTCYIGRVEKSHNYTYGVKLKKSIKKNTLLYSGRVGTYPLQ